MKLDWTANELLITPDGLATLERLYGKGQAAWKPILHYCDFDWHKNWSPKSEVGRSLPPLQKCQYFSVWGGMVKTYEVGYEHQPVELVFVGIDIDCDNRHNTYIGVQSIASAALPEAYIRRSTGGRGAHVFLILREPILCANRAEAAALSQRIVAPYIERLQNAGITHICSVVNPLKIWSFDGLQREVQVGGFIEVDLAALPPAPSYSGTGRGSGRAEVKLADCGSLVRRIIAALDIPVGAQGELPSKWSCHVVEAQRALRGLLPFDTSSPGTKLLEPNAFVAISERGIALFSGPDGITEPLFAIDIDQ